ncbi:GTP cyclohydrolase FolE2 [Pseudomonas sp. X10]
MTTLTLPDIAAQMNQRAQPLEWVGMRGIALPIRFEEQTLTATADAGVNLDDDGSRGIHMSRLYLALEQLETVELNPASISRLLKTFLESHVGLSSSAYLTLRFDYLLKRPALVSPLSGWKTYPVELCARLENEMFHVELKADVPYSSTCPCSAALARQLIQQQFLEDFANRKLDHESVLRWLGTSEGIVATPHSQRSLARLQVRLQHDMKVLPIKVLIDQTEAALGTAVQTAVKRADEQAFALVNGQNLMFCEDAARRLHRALRDQPWLTGFHLRVEHAESLHAHDAVASSLWNWQSIAPSE